MKCGLQREKTTNEESNKQERQRWYLIEPAVCTEHRLAYTTYFHSFAGLGCVKPKNVNSYVLSSCILADSPYVSHSAKNSPEALSQSH